MRAIFFHNNYLIHPKIKHKKCEKKSYVRLEISSITNILIHPLTAKDALNALKPSRQHTYEVERLDNPAGNRGGNFRNVSLIRTLK